MKTTSDEEEKAGRQGEAKSTFYNVNTNIQTCRLLWTTGEDLLTRKQRHNLKNKKDLRHNSLKAFECLKNS